MNKDGFIERLNSLATQTDEEVKKTLMDAMYLTETPITIGELRGILIGDENKKIREYIRKKSLNNLQDNETRKKEDIRADYERTENETVLITKDSETGQFSAVKSNSSESIETVSEINMEELSTIELASTVFNAMSRKISECKFWGNDKVNAQELLDILKTTTKEIHNLMGKWKLSSFTSRLEQFDKMSQHDRNELLLEIISETETSVSYEDLKGIVPEEEWKRKVEEINESTKNQFSKFPNMTEEKLQLLYDENLKQKAICIQKDKKTGNYYAISSDSLYWGRKERIFELQNEAVDKPELEVKVIDVIREKVNSGYFENNNNYSKSDIEVLLKRTMEIVGDKKESKEIEF